MCCTLYMYMYISPSPLSPAFNIGDVDLECTSSLPPPLRPSLPLSGHRQWGRVRRAACLLYQSEPLTFVHSRLEVHVAYMYARIVHVHVYTCTYQYMYMHVVHVHVHQFILFMSSSSTPSPHIPPSLPPSPHIPPSLPPS